MNDVEKIALIGKELTLGDIEMLKSPALREILKEQLLRQVKESREGGLQERIRWSGRFPTCGVLTS